MSFGSKTTASTLRTLLTSAVATVPVAILLRDRFCSVARVQGTSMEPTLRHGDWVLVRKRDVSALFWSADDAVRRYEWIQFGESPSRLSVAPGQVVVFQHPWTLSKDNLLIKRVVGVSGQWISRPGVYPFLRYERMETYSVFVEGDHSDQSIDSRRLGPISKHLVQGVAEYIIWPPSRWGEIEAKVAVDEDGQPRAVWSRNQ